MKYLTPLAQPSTLDPRPSTTICYDCNRSTSGRCWRHQNVIVVRPTVIVPSHTFTPYEHDQTALSPFPIMGDLVTETGPLT